MERGFSGQSARDLALDMARKLVVVVDCFDAGFVEANVGFPEPVEVFDFGLVWRLLGELERWGESGSWWVQRCRVI